MPAWKSLRRLAAAALLAGLGLAGPAGATGLTHGPMVGALRTDSVVVWSRWDAPGTARIRYRPTGSPTLVDGPTATITADHDFTGSFALAGLKANTSYLYTLQFTADTGETANTPNAWFRTPAKLPTSLSFVVLADFMTKEKAAAALRSAATPRPDFGLIIGDLDHSDPAREPGTQDYLPPEDAPTVVANLRQMRRAMRDPARPVGADFVKAFVASKTPQQLQIPLYYVWDDHDFCMNGADGACPFGDPARQVYAEYFVPAADNGLAGCAGAAGGVWQRFTHGGLAEFFLLDARSQRGRAGTTMLGACQKQWLLDGLAASTASWKFIVSPVTFNPGTKPWDAWGAFGAERSEVLDFIAAHGIRNVVVLSADIHSGGALDDGSHAGLPEASVPHANMPSTWVDTYCRLDPNDSRVLLSAGGTWTKGGLVDPNLQGATVACLGTDYSKKRVGPLGPPPYPLPGAANPGYLKVDVTASTATLRVMDSAGQLRRGYAADGSPVDMTLELAR
ncbi:alkaline phosphatase D family protein [Ideonella sp. YS5]